ncbi:hypothetical protein NDU88_005035, partial [Pleurodeles waltl]
LLDVQSLHSPSHQGTDSSGDPDDDASPCGPWLPSSQPPPQDYVPEISDVLDPNEIVHPQYSELAPSHKVANYVVGRIRKPLEKELCNCLR